MTTHDEIITAAETQIRSQPGYHYDPAVLRATVEQGLSDGEVVRLPGNVEAAIKGDHVTVTQDGQVVREVALAEIHDALLSSKAVLASQRGSAVQA